MRLVFSLFLLVASPAAAGETNGLKDALAARSLLGAGTWARVVRIDNAQARGLERRTAYPRTMYGLVFELSGILWFYCDEDGTQSLSVRKGSLERDKADPGPLLRIVSDRLVSWSWVDDPSDGERSLHQLPPNGCFLECLALLRSRIASGASVASPRLLLFYVRTPFGVLGHATLVFGLKEGLAAIEPEQPDRIVAIPEHLGRDPRSLSEYIRGGDVSSVRVLALDAFLKDNGPMRWAALSPVATPAG